MVRIVTVLMGKVGTLNTGNNRAIFGQIGRVSQCAELEFLQQLFKVTFSKKNEFIFNNYRFHAPPFLLPRLQQRYYKGWSICPQQ